MKLTATSIAVLLLATGDLTIDYAVERTLAISVETLVESETTHMSMEIDGESREGRGGGGETTYRREVVYRETVLENEDGKLPTEVKRAFETVSGSRTGMGRDGTTTRDTESPMEDAVLIISLDDGDVVARLEDDTAPERAEMLQGHRLENLLHGLLPPGGEGEEWEPEAAGIAASLLLDVERAFFPPPQFEDGGEGGGRGRGPRGGFSGFGGSGLGFLSEAEWDAKAARTGRTGEVDGVECVVIEIEIEGEGEMPEMGFGRGGRDRMAAPPGAPAGRVLENTFEVDLHGDLYFSLERRQPVKLELEGTFTQDVLIERETPRGEMRIERTVEGTIEHKVTIEQV